MTPGYPQPPPPGMRVCPGCGVIAPIARTDCSVCKHAFGQTPPTAPGREGPLLFACVHDCSVPCRGCGLRTPLGTIVADTTITCVRCGLNQIFDVEQWREALRHAHNVVDLAGPNPEGAFPSPQLSIASKNPHLSIGVQHTSVTYTQATTIFGADGVQDRRMKTTVSPGHPLCTTCSYPLVIELDRARPGVAATTCSRCRARSIFTTPPGALAQSDTLRAVLSIETGADRPEVRTQVQSGVEAIACPQCGAALSLGSGELVTCTYCRLTSRVPRRLALRGDAEVTMVRFWLVFEGRSTLRGALERGRTSDDDDDDVDDDDDDDDSPAFQPPAPMQGAPSPQAIQSKIQLWIGLSILITFLAVGLSIGISLYSSMTSTPTPPPRPVPARPGPPRGH
jgi:hypothetical protein